MQIEFYRHNIGSEEKVKLLECLDGIFLTTGSYVAEFEENLARYLGLDYAVGLSSCTAALHLCLLALGIGEGDEVITSPLTFVATATAIIHAGAKPVFVDVMPETGLLDPDKMEAAITERTKAVIPVHLYGQMCDMRRIRRIADKYGLKLIEDSAHCIEGKRDGIGPGMLGDVACFSFYGTKNITSGEGGAIATNDVELAEHVKLLRTHGMSKGAAARYGEHYQHWDIVECGWKYNMSNIQAAMLLPQLARIDDYWARRQTLYSEYVRRLCGVSGLGLPAVLADAKSAYHVCTVWVDPDKRDRILEYLGEDGIGVAVNYRPIHLLKYFEKTFGFKEGQWPVAEQIGKRTISLPFYVRLQFEDVKAVTSTLLEIVRRYP